MVAATVGLALVSLFVWSGVVRGHEIPADVTIRAFVKPDAAVMRMLVRAPLSTFRDVIMPTRAGVFLDLPAAEDAVRIGADLWVVGGVRMLEEGRDLGRGQLVATRISQPSDTSFDSWERAFAHVTSGPIDPATELVETHALVDVLLEFPITSDRARFAVETEFARLGLRTQTVMQFLPPDTPPRVFQFMGEPGRIELDPSWTEAARRFVLSGIEHILVGTDHLLFLLCLVLPFRQFRSLLLVVTAFTVAHSVTLIAAASGWVPDGQWFAPFVETLIAASIIWMALENIVGASSLHRRWVLTALFGLVHGFGFAFVLGDSLQFGGAHVVTSLIAFNVGVELGQIGVLLVLLPALWALFRYVVAERMGIIVISALVAHQAWHWMTERGADLLTHDLPVLDATFALRAAIVIWVIGGLMWLVHRRRVSFSALSDAEKDTRRL
jgi:hypothetical protein